MNYDNRPLKIRVSVTLDEDVLEKLRALSYADSRSLSSCVNMILRAYLRRIEKEKE